MYFTDKNLMQWGTPCNWISKVLKWNIPTDRAQRVDEKNGGRSSSYVNTQSYGLLNVRNCYFLVFSADNRKKLVTVWAKYLGTPERSYRDFAENGLGRNCPWDIVGRNIKKNAASTKENWNLIVDILLTVAQNSMICSIF